MTAGPSEKVLQVSLAYDRSSVQVELPEGVRIEGGDFPDPIEDPDKRLLEALDDPVEGKPLGEALGGKGRISVLISDMTRGGVTGRLLSVLLGYLGARGAGPANVDVIIAAGTHRGHTPEELEEHLGREIVSQYTIRENNADDAEAHRYVGTTSAGTPCRFARSVVESDLVIGIGTISYHYFAGFGGARKLILPGISSIETIIANHRLSLLDDPGSGLSEGCMPGNLDGNPVHEDMVEGALLLPSHVFMVNAVLDGRGRPVHINAGDMVSSHQEACRWYSGRFSISLDKRYTAVIASAGGAPKDINLLQSHKAIRHASFAVDDGGLLAVAAACPEGTGSDSYRDAFREGRESVPDVVRSEYTLNSQAAISTYDITGRASVYLRTMMEDREVSRFGFCPWKDEYTRYLIEGTDPGDILVIMNSGLFLPVISQ